MDADHWFLLTAARDRDEDQANRRLADGVAAQLVALGNPAQVVDDPARWYDPRPDGSVVVALDPTVDARLMSGRVTSLAWLRDRCSQWRRSRYLDAFDGLLLPSTLAQAEFAERFNGPVGVFPNAVEVTSPGPEASPAATAPADDWYASKLRAGDAARGVLDPALLAALAAGIPSFVRHRNGLAEAGLDDLPGYTTTAERKRLVRAAEAGELADVTARAGKIVRERHSTAVRARELVEFAEQVLRTARGPILDVYPDYSYGNPFQTLLYSALTADGGRVLAVPDLLAGRLSRDPGTDLHGRVLHLHWLDHVVQDAGDLREARARLDDFGATLAAMKQRGLRVVWTIHNALPHAVRFVDEEVALGALVADVADAIHVMSPGTVEVLAPAYRVPTDRVVQLDHPSYAGAYPVLLDRDEARRQLRILPEEIAFSFFGLIRQYKGVERLLDAFALLEPLDARLRLHVTGRIDAPHSPDFRERLTTSDRVFLHEGFVPPSQVQRHLLAADVLVLPFERSLNSGTVALATTFGRPVILPRTTAFDHLAGERFVESFEAGNTESLAEAMWRARASLVTAEAREAAAAYAAARSPQRISRRLVDEVLGLGDEQRR